VDYVALSGSVTFAANSTTSSQVDVSALANNDNDALLTMTVSGDGSLYSTGASDPIHLWGGGMSGTPTVLFDGSHNGDNSGNNPGWIRIDRTEQNISQPLTVYYSFSGNLLIGGTTPPASGSFGTIGFGAGDGEATLTLTDPSGQVGADSGTLTLDPDQNPTFGSSSYFSSPHYNVSDPLPSASVTISDDENAAPTVDLALLGIDHATQQSPGAYLPLDDSFDAGLSGAVSTTTDSVTYQAPGQIADNGKDRNLQYVIPNLLPGDETYNDLWAATLQISNPNSSGPVTIGSLQWMIPSGVKVWWQEGDRWVQVTDKDNVPEGTTFNLYIQGTAIGNGMLKATFTPSGGTAVSDSAQLNVFGVNVTIGDASNNQTDKITVDDAYYLGYTDSAGNPVPDDASTQYPMGNDPDLQSVVVSSQGSIPAGSAFSISLPAGIRFWNTATHQLVYSGEQSPPTNR
jgi:hypothetical protein